MGNLARDNKVLTCKIFHNLKSWLKYTKVDICKSCSPYFWTDFCKINSVYRSYSYVYFKHIPEDSFVTINDMKNDRVLIGIDFNKLLFRDNIVIEKGSGLTIQKNVYNMATTYLKSVSTVLKDKGKGKSTLCYVDLVKELRDVFGYVVTGSSSGDVYTDLLEILNSQTTLKTERQKLLDSIARYFSNQLDDAIDDYLHRIELFGGELSDRDNILLIANINYKKGTVTLPRMSYVSTGWNILKGAKRNFYDINAVTEVLRSGKGSPRENDSYTKLIKELKEVFGFVIDSSINGGRNDELVNLLGMYNNSTAELSDERDRLLDCIANYLEEQVDNAVDDLVHRMYISNAEIQDRNRVLVIANLDFKKNRFTIYDSSKPSSKWKIVKGAKNSPMSFDLSESIGNLRGVRTMSLQVDISFSNVSNYKDNTLYLI